MFLHVLICVTEDRKDPSCGYPIHLLTGETGSISLYATKGLAIELCAAAAADRMSASRRRRFRDVFTSGCTPAICCYSSVMPFTTKLEH